MSRIALLAVALASTAHADPRAPTLERFRLANGLQVMLEVDHRVPLVAVNMYVDAGAGDEEPGRSGFAHLFEHLMFKGSSHVADGQHLGLLEAIGGTSVVATTDWNRTQYQEVVPAHELETALWLESDRLGFLVPAFTDAKLANQRDVVRNERRQTFENPPYGEVALRVPALLFPAPHPYHPALIGTHEDLANATLAQMTEFFRKWYAPGNVTLTLSGDFDPIATRALVEKYFGSIAVGPRTPPHRTDVQPPPATEIREVMRDAVTLPRVTFAWVTTRSYGPGDIELRLAADLLAGSKSSVLHRKLVLEQRIAQSAACSYEPMRLGSVFQCDVVVHAGHTADEVIGAFDRELARLREQGPETRELDRARTRLLAALTRRLESLRRRAYLWSEYLHETGDPLFLPKDYARHRAVTEAAMKAALAQWLDPHHRVVITVLPETKGKP